ncbi:hypothetical protein GM920_16815 [Pedobacter sp. LMG 31462]|uniref:Uncharacterized protein n=2 Tax=Pedobacter gandavensis TaxID=2679963 RepID=A0ABR6EZ86_9SPHI|nr:hypothetical protein [Pedobacter gandavensis]
MNIINIVDHQQFANYQVLTDGSPTFSLPVVVDPESTVATNIDLANFYYGQDESVTFGIDIKSISLEPNGYINGYEGIPAVIVHYKDETGKFGTFCFGATCVMEGMAYGIQELICDHIEVDFFPYHVAEAVCAFLNPELAKDKLTVILLCDIALNTSHPGKFFYDILTDMNNEKFVPVNYLDFYDYLEKYKFTDSQGIVHSFYDMYKQKAEIAIRQLNDYFKIPLYDELCKWFKEIIELGIDFRMKKPGFWIDVLSPLDKEERKNNFRYLTNYFGFPLMTNRKKHYFFSHPNIKTNEIIVLKAIQEIHEVMFYEQKGCNMKEFCKQPEDITSELCNQPWKRATGENLCPFGQIWKMWGLDKKEVIG